MIADAELVFLHYITQYEGEEPLRLHHYVENFPQFQLRAVTSFAKDFSLQSNAILDFWQGEWTTIILDTPVVVERTQQVLLRLCRNLMTAMKDCPGLEKELSLQPTRRPTTNKCTAPPLVSPLKKASRFEQDSDASTLRYQLDAQDNPNVGSNGSLELAPGSLQLIPKSKPTPKSEPAATISRERKWPKDFFVCEVADGFSKIQKLKKEDKKEKDTFSNVFSGVKYTKSTVWKYKKIWQSAKPSLRDEYIQHGRSTSATFSNFLSALNGKRSSDSGLENDISLSSSSDSEEEETTIISGNGN
ncbi:hypothetical protein K443DRAFT_14102 [Laccaria amethystina LaAM-08-1]|uniref:Unplaced genomic scaffold K443scaffold_432, whole genome shotgun sequence n=1 Tax=Laccaria amethystina LaAM-08-1 TaxID=1095629 RepID=A0A0C9WNA8_9AGAR|nr:hypothetical protein K443DRAFT_14102 [Laccaria amethystina LaAM-08-1]